MDRDGTRWSAPLVTHPCASCGRPAFVRARREVPWWAWLWRGRGPWRWVCTLDLDEVMRHGR